MMVFCHKGLGDFIRYRRKSDSSDDSLNSIDIQHPACPDYGFYFDGQNFCPLTYNLMEGNALAFRNLVLKGQRIKSRRWEIYERHFRDFCCEYSRNVLQDNLLFWGGGDHGLINFYPRLSNERYLDLYSKSEVGKYGSERKHLYFEVIVFLLKLQVERDNDIRKGMKECFFLLWDVVPFPYVRIQEIRKMLEDEWATKCSSTFKSMLESAVGTYGDEFSDISVGDVQPREMRHLCRCKIRYILWHNRRKEGHEELNVDALFFYGSPLPQLLVSYLRVVDRRIDPLQESGLGSRVRSDIKIRSENPSGSASSPNDPPGSASFWDKNS